MPRAAGTAKTFALAALVLVLAPCPAHGGRATMEDMDMELAVDSTEHEAAARAAGVDFSFMTSDLSHPGAASDGTASEQWLGRKMGSQKEEIASGHFCQGRGSRLETYYASSHCYWLPEALPPHASQHHRRTPLLDWYGSPESAQSDLQSESLEGQGTCVKVSVCHDDARSEVGVVKYTRSEDIVEIGKDCMGERAIYHKCASQHEAANKEQARENQACEEVYGRWSQAADAVKTCNDALANSPARLEQLQHEIQKANEAAHAAYGIQQQWDAYVEGKNAEMYKLCDLHQGWEAWPMQGNYVRKEDHKCKVLTSDQNWRFKKCQTCYEAHQEVLGSWQSVREAQRAYGEAYRAYEKIAGEPARLQAQMDQCSKGLKQLEAAVEAVNQEWKPQEPKCTKVMADYHKAQSTHLATCVPSHYDVSCEKACLGAANAGCAVAEGPEIGIAKGGGGGVKVPCSPRDPSFVMGYAAEGEGLESQCRRIQQAQPVRYAQKVSKEGWLLKVTKGWISSSSEKVYVVLESGDPVRSAVLRQYTDDKVKDIGVAMVLWDAKDVIAKPGKKYSLKSGEECFQIKHFHGDHILCAPGGAADRDEWMSLITDEMRFKGSIA